ncbi:hypothetical protein M758_UG079000 [Ceratodon purpureus]|nr:hypothetical protein M758_UG079000 [Ceratodon purpureus]
MRSYVQLLELPLHLSKESGCRMKMEAWGEGVPKEPWKVNVNPSASKKRPWKPQAPKEKEASTALAEDGRRRWHTKASNEVQSKEARLGKVRHWKSLGGPNAHVGESNAKRVRTSYG